MMSCTYVSHLDLTIAIYIICLCLLVVDREFMDRLIDANNQKIGASTTCSKLAEVTSMDTHEHVNLLNHRNVGFSNFSITCD